MIEVRSLGVRTGRFQLDDLTFQVPAGSYSVLMGRTGCGKTTLLEALAGLLPATAGQVLLDGDDVTRRRPADRHLGYVPQDGALFPSMTIAEHLSFSLRLRKHSRTDIEARVKELAEELGLVSLLARHPHGLSGGERQRVSLGRALAAKPRVVLLDEPLSALDDESREELATVLAKTQAATRATFLHVTHNREDAERLANHSLQMDAGQVRLESNSKASGKPRSN